MANYSKRYAGGFVDLPSQTTAVDSQFLNAVEASLLRLDGTGASANQVPVSNGTAYTPALLKTANIDPAAGILKSQLASLGIVDADVAVGAAIGPSKIANGILLSQLSGYPSDATKVPKGDGTWGTLSTSLQLDYAQITANTAAISATTEGTAAAVVTGNSVTYDGTRVKVEFFAPQLTANTGGITVTFVLLRDTTVLGQAKANLGSSGEQPLTVTIFDTPSAGAHTYKASVFVSSSSVVVGAGAGGSGALMPAFLRVSKAA